MYVKPHASIAFSVALLAEGVDRNMYVAAPPKRGGVVALLAEGVDRNIKHDDPTDQAPCRPPRGGRG